MLYFPSLSNVSLTILHLLKTLIYLHTLLSPAPWMLLPRWIPLTHTGCVSPPFSNGLQHDIQVFQVVFRPEAPAAAASPGGLLEMPIWGQQKLWGYTLKSENQSVYRNLHSSIRNRNFSVPGTPFFFLPEFFLSFPPTSFPANMYPRK